LVRTGELKEVERKTKKGRKYKKAIYFAEETDFIALRNIQKIEKMLANSDNYSLADLIKLEKKDVCGVPTELREKLVKLIFKKAQEEFTSYQLPHQEEDEDKKEPEQLPTPPPPKRRKSEPEEPTPQDKDQIILALQETISQLKARMRELESSGKTPDSQQVEEIARVQEEITNSDLEESKKQELLRKLEEITNKMTDNQEVKTSSPNIYY
jgi:hypothetical protein